MSGTIDVHHHIVNEPGYVDTLLGVMDDLGIEKTGLIAMGQTGKYVFLTQGEPSGCADERDVARAVKAHPDRFFGYVYVRPGFDGPDKVKRWADEGFLGVKFHLAKDPYHSREYWPIYEACNDAGMVCLFHTGIFNPPRPMPGQFISSANLRPVFLEPVANDFPDLPIIMAHMGICWTDEALVVSRLLSNVYFDISGGMPGWRGGKSAEWWREKLWWEGASRKMLFGSDVHCGQVKAALELQLGIVDDYLGWDSPARDRFLSANARELFFNRA